MKNTFYLTTPIFYPNAKLHLGHAYTMTLADALARYHRRNDEKVHFLAGSDENTQKMVDAAAKAGAEPIAFLDGIVQNFMKLYASLDISYDQFIRTTDTNVHWPGAQALWELLLAAGDLYKKEYEGLYCVGHEAFITDKDLVDGKCPDHGTEPEQLREENYFFRLSKYADALREKIASDELRIVPQSRKKEILSFISGGLEDVSFSRPRRSSWPRGLGIPVPGDDSQVMYVWCDALANYISALGFGRDDALYQEFWPADVHIIGKDILRFHAAIWPAMLLSAGLPLPKTLFVHGFITSGGKKMSKTLGNVIDPEDLIDTYGPDAVRYFLLRHISPFEDGDITREGFKEAYTANLTNGLGNLVARVMKLAEEHLSGPVKLAGEDTIVSGEFAEKVETFRFNEAMDVVFEKIAVADVFMTEREPYKKIKSADASEKEVARRDIESLVRQLASIAAHLAPAMPATSKAILAAIRENRKPENLFPRL
ncbi:methionine--tRNA ligase [Candidatus Kaiserbacteria bacterium]|nr:methionine--tRNA ligase [Candidatus Kaiserbacteria bacterium]